MLQVIRKITSVVFCSALLLGCSNGMKANPQVKIEFTNKIGLEFVKIPGGSFNMGSEKSAVASPVHRVKLDSFYISTTEVTNIQFSRFRKIKRPKYSLGDEMPVMNVSRKEIEEFLEWLSKLDGRKYSLPTEAQWEYSARSGLENVDYPWGDNFEGSLLNIGSDILMRDMQAKNVKQYPPNSYGLYDICGNASEEVYDGDYEYGSKEAINPRMKPPTQSDQLSIVRGVGIGYYNPQVWYRKFRSPMSKDQPVGFRVVVQNK